MVDSRTVSQDYCDPKQRPTMTKRCKERPCPAWVTGEWERVSDCRLRPCCLLLCRSGSPCAGGASVLVLAVLVVLGDVRRGHDGSSGLVLPG